MHHIKWQLIKTIHLGIKVNVSPHAPNTTNNNHNMFEYENFRALALGGGGGCTRAKFRMALTIARTAHVAEHYKWATFPRAPKYPIEIAHVRARVRVICEWHDGNKSTLYESIH